MIGVETESDKEMAQENTELRKNENMAESQNSRFQ